MKILLGMVGLVAAGLLVWGFRANGPTGLMVIIAVGSVLFFGSIPVVLGALSRGRAARTNQTNTTRVVVRQRPTPPAEPAPSKDAPGS